MSSGKGKTRMPDGPINPESNYLASLDANAAGRWPTLAAARADAIAVCVGSA
jgi:hypothetical protein